MRLPESAGFRDKCAGAKVKVRAQDLEGKTSSWRDGAAGAAFQHEIDHLDGFCFPGAERAEAGSDSAEDSQTAKDRRVEMKLCSADSGVCRATLKLALRAGTMCRWWSRSRIGRGRAST